MVVRKSKGQGAGSLERTNARRRSRCLVNTISKRDDRQRREDRGEARRVVDGLARFEHHAAHAVSPLQFAAWSKGRMNELPLIRKQVASWKDDLPLPVRVVREPNHEIDERQRADFFTLPDKLGYLR